MNTAEDFNRLYADVSRNIQQTLTDIAALHVENEEGKQQLQSMVTQLQSLQDGFNQKLTWLQKHAEWDKFTLAFFGETNAGKSTIIESLRILFDEESRRQLLQKNHNDLEKAELELQEISERLRSDLGRVYSDVVDKITDISFSALRLTQILDNESALRHKREEEESKERLLVEQKESQLRLQLEQNESQSRLQILQKRTSAKTRLTLCIAAVISFVAGAGASAAVVFNMIAGQ
ncbi:hypothetical protein DUW02_21070 [Salmonella enterica subsp. enterica serovar Senftenberg]|uniref:hypothetical protein n=1 Tax=Escherichia coli TaxID=562 RepID=UPI0012CBCD35|nr:hypothetical protein [Escherichia coli]EBY1364574.1 hypothetical protein [Salmonella enterica subsp. enterica serovar Senftenberg]HBM0491350.1 hypothetical protein [Salmonella enterica]ECB4821606.1 hypothetical protein [Salmonella enterica subsp. enterica serovar Senftenberg]ECD2842130.1 hypothetical protein [Salmonella enterica subsp. enterica serovar Senftenberg]ECF4112556.1 hypothetical protein [Salmonella enterica subsp. enterica serovar Senftenberg]